MQLLRVSSLCIERSDGAKAGKRDQGESHGGPTIHTRHIVTPDASGQDSAVLKYVTVTVARGVRRGANCVAERAGVDSGNRGAPLDGQRSRVVDRRARAGRGRLFSVIGENATAANKALQPVPTRSQQPAS